MEQDLVTVATYHHIGEAEAARMHLEAEGFTAYLGNAEAATILTHAGGEIRLLVPKSEAEMATVLLRKMEKKRRDRVEGEDFGADECLACGAEIPEYASKCPACGWSYEDES